MAIETKSSGKLVWGTRSARCATPAAATRVALDAHDRPGKVYALGLNGDLVCLDLKTGRILWRHDLVKDFGGEIPNWGYAESP